jgi:hypothetical protein
MLDDRGRDRKRHGPLPVNAAHQTRERDHFR